jgi:hypothetical protein
VPWWCECRKAPAFSWRAGGSDALLVWWTGGCWGLSRGGFSLGCRHFISGAARHLLWGGGRGPAAPPHGGRWAFVVFPLGVLLRVVGIYSASWCRPGLFFRAAGEAISSIVFFVCGVCGGGRVIMRQAREQGCPAGLCWCRFSDFLLALFIAFGVCVVGVWRFWHRCAFFVGGVVLWQVHFAFWDLTSSGRWEYRCDLLASWIRALFLLRTGLS